MRRAAGLAVVLLLLATGPRTAPAAGNDGGFTFTRLRVQLSNRNDAPAVTRVRSGQPFRIAFYLKKTRRAGKQATFSYTMGNRSGGQLAHNRETVTFVSLDSVEGWKTFGLTVKLAEGRTQATYIIDGTVRMNGVSQRRKTSLTVYR